MDAGFCCSALDRALQQGHPEIFNTDQGAQFTSEAFTSRLSAENILISIDGRGRALDNYSSMRYSPAALVSASPAGVDYASGLTQLRGIFNNERSRTEKPNQTQRQRSTLTGQFFCPKNGEYLTRKAFG